MIDKSTISFLCDLAKNNKREWYHVHKGEYKSALENFAELVSALLFRLSEFDPDILGTEPKECMFRIYRDIRFSKDKTPYKPWFSARLAPGGKNYSGPGYYVRVAFDGSRLATGIYRPEREKLDSIRKGISAWPNQFEEAVNGGAFNKYYRELIGEKLKRPPAGFSKEDPAIEWIKHKSFVGWHHVPKRLITSSKFVDHAMDAYRAGRPLMDFLKKCFV